MTDRKKDRDWDGHFKDTYTSSEKLDWQTPQWLYDHLNAEFEFDLDAAASAVNTKHKRWLGPGGVHEDALVCSWGPCLKGSRLKSMVWSVFLNPPYGREIAKWYVKAYAESRRRGMTVATLVNANTETTYWRDFVWPHAAEIRFISGRVGYEHPDSPDLKTKQTKGSAIIVWRWSHDGPPNKVFNVEREEMKQRFDHTDHQFAARRKAKRKPPPPPSPKRRPPPPPPRSK